MVGSLDADHAPRRLQSMVPRPDASIANTLRTSDWDMMSRNQRRFDARFKCCTHGVDLPTQG
jgi:hypothetical protein